jgi:hydrogenase maturation protein HypF
MGKMAARFHGTLVDVAVAVALRMRDELGLTRVCLGGGCFQNMRLLDGCVTGLRTQGFEVFYPVDMPANDGGIALGQAAIAAEWMRLRGE